MTNNASPAGEKREYPIGGYAPGSYQQHCSCGTTFLGDKRAFQCEPCALRDEVTHKWIIEILDFVAQNNGIEKTGDQLYNEYNKVRFDKIIKELKTPTNG